MTTDRSQAGRGPRARPVRARPRDPAVGRTVEVTITGLGAAGDGLASYDDRALYIPLCLPGERVRVEITGRRGDGLAATIVEMLAPAAERAVPACRHYGECGGCDLQHLADGAAADFKAQLVVEALARRAIRVPVLPTRVSPAASRRRATLAIRRTARGVILGFNAPESARVVDIAECPVVRPRLAALVAPIRASAPGWLHAGEAADVSLTEGDGSIDMLIRATHEPSLEDREALATLAESLDLARVSWAHDRGESQPIAWRRPFRVPFGPVAVEPPPGGFLQATEHGEATLAEVVLGALPERGRLVDLFAGCGTFALRLAARGAEVRAVEGDAAAIAALGAAARGAMLAVTAERRDLDDRPLTAADLADVAGLVFDPPRTGARGQAEEIAESAVPVVVAVSCNPASFARDARILIDGGYALDSVQPVDQFRWTAHVELVAVFRRR
ncbi:MAG: TRAM domain-containing protein [Alphaproteobacteria bacterium]|nr:TRAM domain-containing protein [Alphaproteobacteria bacterium]